MNSPLIMISVLARSGVPVPTCERDWDRECVCVGGVDAGAAADDTGFADENVLAGLDGPAPGEEVATMAMAAALGGGLGDASVRAVFVDLELALDRGFSLVVDAASPAAVPFACAAAEEAVDVGSSAVGESSLSGLECPLAASSPSVVPSSSWAGFAGDTVCDGVGPGAAKGEAPAPPAPASSSSSVSAEAEACEGRPGEESGEEVAVVLDVAVAVGSGARATAATTGTAEEEEEEARGVGAEGTGVEEVDGQGWATDDVGGVGVGRGCGECWM
jgi:hypothetical protein